MLKKDDGPCRPSLPHMEEAMDGFSPVQDLRYGTVKYRPNNTCVCVHPYVREQGRSKTEREIGDGRFNCLQVLPRMNKDGKSTNRC